MENFRILIVEDEILIAENYKDLLHEFGINHIEIAESLESAKQLLDLFQPDLCLVDVRLDVDAEGIEFGKYILEHKNHISIVYLTAQSDLDTIREMVKTKPINYISKPVRIPDLMAVLELAYARLIEDEELNYCWLFDGTQNVQIKKEHILYSQSVGNYQQIFMADGSKMLTRMTTEYLLETLGSDSFCKINRFQIVNLKWIEKYSRKAIQVRDVSLKVSPNCADELKKRIGSTNY